MKSHPGFSMLDENSESSSALSVLKTAFFRAPQSGRTHDADPSDGRRIKTDNSRSEKLYFLYEYSTNIPGFA
jgi:hypothetical protein